MITFWTIVLPSLLVGISLGVALAWLYDGRGKHNIDYGFATGRHWMSIDGKMIYQGPGADVWMRDEDIHRLVYHTIDKGKHWTMPIQQITGIEK